MKLKIIGCGVFEPYITHLQSASENEIDFEELDAGLHARPNDLRLLIQQKIDATSKDDGYDAIVLFYGLCGRGTAGLTTRDVSVVIPKAHDCITLFMGSQEKYLREFNAHPGTIYHTLGWIEKKINAKNREIGELYNNFDLEGYENHPEFSRLSSAYGSDNAGYILAFFDRWKKNYTRAAYIDMGVPGETKLTAFTSEIAKALDWKHEVLKGDMDLLEDLLKGDWHDNRILIVPPNAKTIATGDDQVLGYVAINSSSSETVLNPGEEVVHSETNTQDATPPEGIGLGIDAGGTYTDAVVWDIGEKKLMAKSKSLTTHHNLIEGIQAAISGLPKNSLKKVQITSLSTTLATNSVVEGIGHKVGVISLSPWDWTEEEIDHGPIINVPGHVSINGTIEEPLDEEAVKSAVSELADTQKCMALVVAGYALHRNPEQANRVREIACGMTDIPVICSHEVSRMLNGVHAAQTAVANAKLIPIIRSLLDSVHQALATYEISGKLMVVKADGTPVEESIARARPVETILSGPAASVTGAHIITGCENALVLDIGGTTTDCAILESGRVAVTPKGARIGDWTMSIDAVEISTVGLGGDSRIDFTGERKIKVGPVRNVPLCFTASEHPEIMQFLNDFDELRYSNVQDASYLDVLVPGVSSEMDYTDREKQLLDIVTNGPTTAMDATAILGLPSISLLPLSRLEKCGAIRRSALTPTDLMHVTGEFKRWSSDAAKRALEIFSAMYGRPAEMVLDVAMRAVTRRLFEEIVRREISYEDRNIQKIPEDWQFVMDKAFSPGESGLDINFDMKRPVVAIGAPAAALLPPVSRHMDVEIIVPDHADVANAIGAIASEIVVREEILIRPGELSNYVLHGECERIEYSELEKATQKAVEITRQRARQRALDSGAIAPEVTVVKNDGVGSAADGASVFLERRVVAIATGGAFGRTNRTCVQ